MSRARIYTLASLGFLWGAVAFGVPISVLHLVHNRLSLIQDALILGVFLSLLFGGAGAVACTVAGVLSRFLPGGRDASRPPDSRTFAVGLALFHLAFFEPVATVGFTYDQVPFFSPGSWPGMVASPMRRKPWWLALTRTSSFASGLCRKKVRAASWAARITAAGTP